MTIVTEITSLSDAVDYFRRVPDTSARAARLAINSVANRGALKLARERITDEVDFPKGYLSGDRLRVTKLAKEGDLEAVITARKRATSLARFASGQPLGSRSGAGVRVRVKKGSSVHIRKGWLVKLNAGARRASQIEDGYNVGLAIRIRPGESISNKASEHRSWLVKGQVALLYGPSVDQIFRSVAPSIAGEIGGMVADEFFRQFQRLTS